MLKKCYPWITKIQNLSFIFCISGVSPRNSLEVLTPEVPGERDRGNCITSLQLHPKGWATLLRCSSNTDDQEVQAGASHSAGLIGQIAAALCAGLRLITRFSPCPRGITTQRLLLNSCTPFCCFILCNLVFLFCLGTVSWEVS